MQQAGADLKHVVKASVFFADINERGKFNDAWKQYFPDDKPVRTTTQVGAFPRHIRIERAWIPSSTWRPISTTAIWWIRSCARMSSARTMFARRRVNFGVKRLVLTSSVQVVEGFGRGERTIRVDEGMKPRNLYALTKAWGEMLGDMYAVLYSLGVIHVRVGWLPRSLDQAQYIARSAYGQNIYLSYADAQRFFERCVEADVPAPGESLVFFAGSRPHGLPHMDLEPARRLLGYEPQDTWPENMPFTLV